MSTPKENDVVTELDDLEGLYTTDASSDDENPGEVEWGNEDSLEGHEEAEQPTEDEAPVSEVVEPDVEEFSELEEKYRGKSIQDIVEMHKNAEKTMHQKMNELTLMENKFNGLQDVTSKVLDRKLGIGEDEDKGPAVSPEEFWENPEAAVQKILEAAQAKVSPAVEEKVVSSMTEEDFKAKHEDAEQIGGSKEFQDWLQAAPVRMTKLQGALATQDFAIADELIVTYKEINAPKLAAEKDAAKAKREEEAKEFSGTNTSRSVKREQSVISEAAVMELIRTDRPKYERLMEPGQALYLAYAENRVK